MALWGALGCSKAPETPPLEGSWREKGSPEDTLTFGPGGAFRQVSYGQTYEGTWSRPKPDRVVVVFTGNSVRLGTVELQITLDKNGLLTRNPKGRLQEWVRP